MRIILVVIALLIATAVDAGSPPVYNQAALNAYAHAHPGDEAAWHSLGTSYLDQGDNARASDALVHATKLSLDRGHIPEYLNETWTALVYTKDLAKLRSTFNDVLRRGSKNNEPGYYSEALIYYANGLDQ